MEFSESLTALAKKVQNHRDTINTEEAAKNAFIMPFISQVLGYDVFDPHEVIPEFTADVGVKKGEKVDYAIMHDNVVQILIECKKSREPLKVEHVSQLYRYFTVTHARIAVLTNGEVYQFYTDLDAPNRMDDKPFLVLDLNDIDEMLIPELRKLTKEVFDLDSVINAAEELKYLGQIRRLLSSQFRDPEDEWVKFFASRVYDGAFTKKIREQFRHLVTKAALQFLNDQVNDRLKTALGSNFPEANDESSMDDESEEPNESSAESDIETTLEELEGYQIVKAIACSEVSPDRIIYRDAKSYLSIIIDNNNRKPVARLHFNGKSRKYLGTFDSQKIETRHLIESLDDIYRHAEVIRSSAKQFGEN